MKAVKIMLFFKKAFWAILPVNMFTASGAAVVVRPNILTNAEALIAVSDSDNSVGGTFTSFPGRMLLLLPLCLQRRRLLAACVRRLVLSFLMVLGVSQAVFAGSHPNMYLSADEIAAIKEKVNAGQAPWRSAYDRMISDANTALNQSPVSVTAAGKNNCSGTVNLYCTEPPYDTVNADRSDYMAIIAFGRAVRNLGLGYAFTGNTAYADKAIALIRAWVLDPVTYMAPAFSNRQSQIEIYITLPGAFYGADLIWNYSGWDATEKTAFLDWVRTISNEAILQPDPTRKNFSNWRDVLVIAAGVLLEDASLINFAVEEYKELIPYQISSIGLMKEEYGRQTGLSYSLYAINAMTQTAEIARHQGIDLYNFRISDGRGLELALDYHQGFAMNPSTWPYKQVGGFNGDNTELYELVYSRFQKPAYLSVVNKYGRPMYEKRVIGAITLTHGNRFELALAPVAADIVAQPESVTVTEGEDARFNLVATGSGPLSYKWFRNGNIIAGATGASYKVTRASSSDNGGVYTCDVSNSLGSVRCNDAVLTVLSDSVAPTLVSAVAASDTRVDIVFSEPVTASSAENTANYQIDPDIIVTSARLEGDGRTVSLIVNQLTTDTAYTVRVSNIQDVAPGPNTIAAQSSQNFTYRSVDAFEDGNANGWSELTASNWDVVPDGGDMAYYLNTTDFSSPGGGRLGEYSLLPGEYDNFSFTAQARLGDNVADNDYADYAVIFGFQDPDNYYYAMFNNTQGATQLIRVKEGSRTALATATNDWLSDNAYHSIVVSRVGSEISVSFDDVLIMSARDNTFAAGKVGVGSYNDSAYFDDVRVVAVAAMSDETAPVIMLIGDNPQTIIVGTAYPELDVIASDNVDGDISASVAIDASAVDTASPGTYHVTYNVTDTAGNTATEVSRTVNVIAATVNESDNSNSGSDNSNGGGSYNPLELLILSVLLLALRRRNNRAPGWMIKQFRAHRSGLAVSILPELSE